MTPQLVENNAYSMNVWQSACLKILAQARHPAMVEARIIEYYLWGTPLGPQPSHENIYGAAY